METKKFFLYVSLCFTLLLFLVPEVGAGWEEMEILKYNFDIDAAPRYQQYPVVTYNSIDNEFMCLYSVTGPLRDDCELGDEHECTADFMSIESQRVSPDGEILGDPIQLSPPEPRFKFAPSRFGHNTFTNEYMVPFSLGVSYLQAGVYVLKTDNVGNIRYGPYQVIEGEGQGHAMIIYNPVEREYLLVFNAPGVYNEHMNNIGYILNENGDPAHGPFPVGNQEGGDLYAPYAAYNSTDSTYLVVWEDFRNVDDYMFDPGDIYGALLDADGNMIVEIPVIDDYFDNNGTPDGADQRVPRPVYNPDRNEFLVVWRDHRLSLNDGGIIGRIIGPEGTPKGPDFVVADPPRIQSSPEPIYVEEEKKYFMTWHDTQNDTSPPGTAWWFSDNTDIYGRWLDETGSPIGDEIPLCVEEGWQLSATMAYDPAKKRFLITWYDRNALNDYEPAVPPAEVPFATAPSEVRGTLYGIPGTTCLALEIYGEYSDEIKLLRNFRDNVLINTPGGKELIKLYYEWSPVIVKVIEKNEAFKKEVKELIDGVLELVGAKVE